MATRIEAGSSIANSVADVEFARTARFKDHGRLPAPPGADGSEVRCSCNTCGAHLYAMRRTSGNLEGVCVVCGGLEVTPVV
jgi:hypothetical protein